VHAIRRATPTGRREAITHVSTYLEAVPTRAWRDLLCLFPVLPRSRSTWSRAKHQRNSSNSLLLWPLTLLSRGFFFFLNSGNSTSYSAPTFRMTDEPTSHRPNKAHLFFPTVLLLYSFSRAPLFFPHPPLLAWPPSTSSGGHRGVRALAGERPRGGATAGLGGSAHGAPVRH
jgi:hypothetical protein